MSGTNGSTLSANEVRQRLQSALEEITPLERPVPELRHAVGRRKRQRWFLAGGLGSALAGAAAAVVVTLVVGSNTTARLPISKSPTPPPLATYAHEHGGKRVAGPVNDASGEYGAYTTKKQIVVVKAVDGQWQQDGKPLHNPGFLSGFRVGPTINSAGATFLLKTVGGDVSYFGMVVIRLDNGWHFARFGKCGAGQCYPGNSEPYLRAGGSADVFSINNDCTPYCAAGTMYRVAWSWDPEQQKFFAASVTKQHH